MGSISTDVWTPAFSMRDLSGHKSKPAGSVKNFLRALMSMFLPVAFHSGNSIGILIL